MTGENEPDMTHYDLDHTGPRFASWRRDYSRCACPRDWETCPHCGVADSDSTHRGRCHARLATPG